MAMEIKQMNEPVAWMVKGTPEAPYQSITNTKIEPTVVSYTHPVKEQLTDEEILARL